MAVMLVIRQASAVLRVVVAIVSISIRQPPETTTPGETATPIAGPFTTNTRPSAVLYMSLGTSPVSRLKSAMVRPM
ncbi:hypothetical protein NLM16_27150 [Bradyrhizobium brasilense]|uniref:hypothetical protein n=1 Tax=Bradyrhizobium brasilense TaxID=1419277 RepID=UPI002877E2E1|nr:hypothetical protein [Bradyrhizobium brasilense]MCP3417791.1 hypothetical protein [Bradyrhizobium brasilense]